LCMRMKDYSTFMQSLNSLGNVENMSVQRKDRAHRSTRRTHRLNISIHVYSQGNIASQ
jgi:hypothetical protein